MVRMILKLSFNFIPLLKNIFELYM